MKSEFWTIKRKEKEGQKFLWKNKDFYFGADDFMKFNCIFGILIGIALPFVFPFLSKLNYGSLFTEILFYFFFSAFAIFSFVYGIYYGIKLKHCRKDVKTIKEQGQRKKAVIKKIFCYVPKRNPRRFGGYSFMFDVDGVLHTAARSISALMNIWRIDLPLPKAQNLRYDDLNNLFFVDIIEREVPVIVFENKYLFTDLGLLDDNFLENPQ